MDNGALALAAVTSIFIVIAVAAWFTAGFLISYTAAATVLQLTVAYLLFMAVVSGLASLTS
jgi:hypothetical protein